LSQLQKAKVLSLLSFRDTGTFQTVIALTPAYFFSKVANPFQKDGCKGGERFRL